MAITRPGCEEFVALMKRAGWTASETARRLNVSNASISSYVTGERMPPAAKLVLLRMLVDQSETGEQPQPEQGLPQNENETYEQTLLHLIYKRAHSVLSLNVTGYQKRLAVKSLIQDAETYLALTKAADAIGEPTNMTEAPAKKVGFQQRHYSAKLPRSDGDVGRAMAQLDQIKRTK